MKENCKTYKPQTLLGFLLKQTKKTHTGFKRQLNSGLMFYIKTKGLFLGIPTEIFMNVII